MAFECPSCAFAREPVKAKHVHVDVREGWITSPNALCCGGAHCMGERENHVIVPLSFIDRQVEKAREKQLRAAQRKAK